MKSGKLFILIKYDGVLSWLYALYNLLHPNIHCVVYSHCGFYYILMGEFKLLNKNKLYRLIFSENCKKYRDDRSFFAGIVCLNEPTGSSSETFNFHALKENR